MVCVASQRARRAFLHTYIYSSHGSLGYWDRKKMSPEALSDIDIMFFTMTNRPPTMGTNSRIFLPKKVYFARQNMD